VTNHSMVQQLEHRLYGYSMVQQLEHRLYGYLHRDYASTSTTNPKP